MVRLQELPYDGRRYHVRAGRDQGGTGVFDLIDVCGDLCGFVTVCRHHNMEDGGNNLRTLVQGLLAHGVGNRCACLFGESPGLRPRPRC